MAQLSSSENNAAKLHQNSWKKLSEKKVIVCVGGGEGGSVPPGTPGFVCPKRVYCIEYIKYLVSQISKLKKKK